jgi:hypothetical protein
MKMDKQEVSNQFTSDHGMQYQNLASDARLYAEQRFKVAAVFLIANGFFSNIAAKYPTFIVGLIGIVFSYLCLSWEIRTNQWWAILFEGLKALERLARNNGKMIEVYGKYPKKPLLFFVKASHAIIIIYGLGILGWVIYILYLVFFK